MDKDAYSIISTFECNGKKMLVVRMNGVACVMPEEDYRIIITKRKYKQRKNRQWLKMEAYYAYKGTKYIFS